jgi:hypothetical protein
MKWVNLSMEHPKHWGDIILRLLPDNIILNEKILISSDNITLPIRKNAKNIPINFYLLNNLVPRVTTIPIENVEWLDTTQSEAFTPERLTEEDESCILALFYRIKNLGNVSEDLKIKEFFEYLDSYGFKITKK